MRLGPTHRVVSELHQNTLRRYVNEELLLHHAHRRSTGIRRARTRRNRERRSVRPSIVDQTVSQLRSHGYQVILNKVGTAPLNQCAVMCSLAPLPRHVSVPVTSLPT